MSVSKVHANNKVIAHPRGKQLGGSSAINFMFWAHASQQDIDNWGQLGNANWSWKSLDPYFKRSERFISPSSVVEQDLQTESVDPSLYGESGPLDEAWPQTFEALRSDIKSDP